jgi:5-methylthioadenosine/S-adenosylhomocysteine deaminase
VAGPQVGRLEPGWLADVVVMRRRHGDPYRNLVHATERDVRLVVVGGEPRYGLPSLMAGLGAADPTTVTVGGLRRAAVIRSPQNPDRFLAWADVVARLEAVRSAPQDAAREVAQALAAVGGDLGDPDAPLVLFGDMPLPAHDGPGDDANGGGDPAIAGRNDPPGPCPIPPIESLVHDAAWFDRIDAHPFHRGLLSPLRGFYP